MAIYHLSIKIIGRSKGKSAVAAAAYRAGDQIINERDGIMHDYTKKGGVVHTEIMLPENAPSEYTDRSVLWNAVEKIEKADNSQLAREIELALPVELSKEQNISLVREYVKEHFVLAGMCADVCIHDKNDGNPHAHIMLTMRPLDGDGAWGAKQKKEYILDGNGEKIYDSKKRQYKCKSIPTTDWNEQAKAEEWRQGWADCVNCALEKADHTERIDHRSYERQGIDQIPTVHLGVAASAMEKRGIRTERGKLNREIEISNQRLRQIKARLVKLQIWLEEAANSAPPTLADVIQDILSRREQSGHSDRYQSVTNLKAASQMLIFLQQNQIMDMAGLEEKVKSMFSKQDGILANLKSTERRIKTLDEHIKQADIYLAHKPVFTRYQQEKNPKAKATYAENYRAEITLYEAANRYLKGVMNGRTTLPTKAWKAERDTLTIERKRLNQEYILLKDEVKEVEKIRRSVYDILREDMRREQPKKKQEIELRLKQ